MSTRSQDSASGNEAGGEETEWDNASVIGDGDGGEAEVDGVGRRGIGRRTISGPVATTPNGDKRPSRVRSKSLGGGENLFATAKTVLDRRARFAANVESPAGPNLKSVLPASSVSYPAYTDFDYRSPACSPLLQQAASLDERATVVSNLGCFPANLDPVSLPSQSPGSSPTGPTRICRQQVTRKTRIEACPLWRARRDGRRRGRKA